MAAPLQLALVALCGALAVLGLALGAASQNETFLEPDQSAQDAEAQQGASGNIVVLTAVPVAAAAALGAALLARRRPLTRIAMGLVTFGASYTAVLLAQSAYPNYFVFVEERFVPQLTMSLAAANVPAVPSLFLPIFALFAAAVLAGGWALRRLLGSAAEAPTPDRLLAHQAAAVLLATPFLVVEAWGTLRLLLQLPGNHPGLGPYFVVLPLACLACLSLAGLGIAKLWRLGTFVRNGRLAAAVQESWQTLGRAELAVAVVLALLAGLASLLRAEDLGSRLYGGSFATDLRGHTQFLILLAVPCLPALLHQRRVQHYLEGAPLHRATLESGTHRLAVATASACAASAILSGLATWAAPNALWPWLLALLPAAGLATLRLDAAQAATPTLVAAFALWAIGNTITASYGDSTDATLHFIVMPGVLALLRTLAAALAGIAVARLARRLAGAQRPAAAVPMAIAAGTCLASLGLLEMPLSAWLTNRADGQAIAVGSLMASLDPPVRILLHSVATVLGVATALLLARLHRPEWFRPPPPPPLPAPMRVKAQRPPRPAARTPA
jgi:hypothetical protein